MRILVCSAIAFLLFAALYGCEDEEKIIGCKLYNHVYDDYIRVGTEHDTVYVFFAAGNPEEFLAPLTFSMVEVSSYTDTIIMELSVYGVSATKYPEPFTEVEWRSDTLLVWYSGFGSRLDQIDLLDLRVPATPPCPMPWYRIDHVIVLHAPGIVVCPHEEVLRY